MADACACYIYSPPPFLALFLSAVTSGGFKDPLGRVRSASSSDRRLIPHAALLGVSVPCVGRTTNPRALLERVQTWKENKSAVYSFNLLLILFFLRVLHIGLKLCSCCQSQTHLSQR